MGRWSQRTRSGGGMSLNWMTQATIGAIDQIEVLYLTPVNVASFSVGDFITDPGTIVPDSLSQFGTNGLLLQMPEDISAEANLIYSGDTSGVLSPQTVTISG